MKGCWHFEKLHKAVIVFDELITLQSQVLAFGPVALGRIECGNLHVGWLARCLGGVSSENIAFALSDSVQIVSSQISGKDLRGLPRFSGKLLSILCE